MLVCLVGETGPQCFRPPFVANAVRNPPQDPDLPNGRYSVGTVLTYTCLPGYVNVGSPTATCQGGVWLVSRRLGDPRCVGK